MSKVGRILTSVIAGGAAYLTAAVVELDAQLAGLIAGAIALAAGLFIPSTTGSDKE